MISSEELKQAEERGTKLHESIPHAVQATYIQESDKVWVRLSSGLELLLSPSSHPALADADTQAKSDIQINAAGFELYFPKIDEGLWLPYVLEDLLRVRSFLAESIRNETAERSTDHTAAA